MLLYCTKARAAVSKRAQMPTNDHRPPTGNQLPDVSHCRRRVKELSYSPAACIGGGVAGFLIFTALTTCPFELMKSGGWEGGHDKVRKTDDGSTAQNTE